MIAKSIMPQIRFKGFSGEWEEKKLGDITEIIGGGTPNTNIPEYWNGEIDWYSPTEIGKNIYASGSVKKITLLGLEKSSARVLPAGKTVLFTSRAGIGSVAILKKDGATNQGFQSFIIKDTHHTYFIYSISNKIKKYALKIASGSTFLEISGKQLAKINIQIPKKDEQSKIGNYFQNLDRLIEKKEKKHRKLKQLKKVMLEKMFPKDGKNTPEIRFKGFSGEWDNEKLEELADFSKGQGYSKSDLVDFGISIILYGRLYTKYQTVISKVDTFVLKNDNSIFSKGNEVIVPSSGETAEDIARASAITVKGTILGGDLNIIYPGDKINNIFLALNISNGKTQKDLSKRAQGKSVVHLRNNDLKEVNLSYPDKIEQIKIGNYFQKLDKLIELQLQELKKLKNIKKASLDKMFV